jgi:glutamyl-tRNA synthetase
LDEWTLESTERAARDYADELGVKPGVVINGIRAVVTGQIKGPGLFDVLMAIGRERTVSRLEKTPELFEGRE